MRQIKPKPKLTGTTDEFLVVIINLVRLAGVALAFPSVSLVHSFIMNQVSLHPVMGVVPGATLMVAVLLSLPALLVLTLSETLAVFLDMARNIAKGSR